MILIKNGYVKPMVGEDIENGCVLIGDDGKIVAVGKDLEEPADCLIIDAEGRLVTPGCVDAHSTSVSITKAWAGRAMTTTRSSIL